MGFGSVYRSLTEIFPQIDARILRAVAIEHPKDADEAAAVVLSEIIPSFSSNLSHNLTQSSNKSSGSISDREERGLEDVVSRCRPFLGASGSKPSTSSSCSSSSSETLPLVVVRDHNTRALSTDLVSNMNEPTNLQPNVGLDVCHKDLESEEVQSLKKARGKEHGNYDFFGRCFDVKSNAKLGLLVPEDDIASVVSAISLDNIKLTSDFWEDLCFGMTWNQAENAVSKLVDSTPGDTTTTTQQGSCFEVDSGSTNLVDETSNRSLVSENGDTEIGDTFSTSTHVCSVDHLEEIIEDAKSNKKTLLTEMETVTNLMREVELQEKDAEKSKEEAARGGLDTLQKVEELKKMLEHAKEANDMHAGEVYGEKSILATEVKELENRLLNLSEERNKSLTILDEMRGSLEIRLATALEMKKTAEQEKKNKEDSALQALVEQEANMEKVVQESKLLQQEAEENSKLREFLMDRGQIVDSLQGEISVICQDVKLLKEKFENRVQLTNLISSSLTSSCGSSMRSLVLGNPSERLNGVPETSSNKNFPEAAASFMNKEKDDCRDLLEDGWDIFDKETEQVVWY
ncbi:uncharacterized protein LOC9325515 isoform X2 [Arabidopsis lyrata subsp. lyrata]|uniref:uncharacterized protein LOC9325515 isoform X2 n=1 Tax=Arabidopsis lyrata subsp. lyrata TaxID=81972 RepID=UPI000A29A5E1|nr:uncharacterized protein LOC9325515 isoform X2 [Arabidopsis lyrata subsp. lyrata]|eukprot:XP_020870314.1 uncharacterized protein LOC9325515 isoform X2 [Arabidopsis lyrata subsp. lyrata]